MLEHTITTSDGRRLQVIDDGDPAGRPILVHNGTPNARLLYRSWTELARRQGVRLISYDRPGYGGSDRMPGRSVADCATDVRAIAEALGIERLGVWGASGGGPHALACAALLGDLVPAVAVLASTAPYPAPGIDYFDGMGEMNVEDIKLELSDPDAAWSKCQADRIEMLSATAEGLLETFESLVSPVDRAAVTPELARYLVDSLQDGLAPGAEGWWDDGEAMLHEWGFELDQIETPVLLLHGRQDRFVPFQHGQWLAARVPGAEAWLSDDDGHLTLTENRLDQVHEWLLARM